MDQTKFTTDIGRVKKAARRKAKSTESGRSKSESDEMRPGKKRKRGARVLMFHPTKGLRSRDLRLERTHRPLTAVTRPSRTRMENPNPIGDPIDYAAIYLPYDILRRICLALYQEEYPSTLPGLRCLLSITRSWRAAALGTPQLWSYISIHNVGPEAATRYLEASLPLTGSLPLDIFIKYDRMNPFQAFLRTAFRLLTPHLDRWRTLVISPYTDPHYVEPELLRVLTGDAPCLTHLYGPGYNFRLTSAALQVLHHPSCIPFSSPLDSRFPNLSALDIGVLKYEGGAREMYGVLQGLTALTHLRFRETVFEHVHEPVTLDLPALTHLTCRIPLLTLILLLINLRAPKLKMLAVARSARVSPSPTHLGVDMQRLHTFFNHCLTGLRSPGFPQLERLVLGDIDLDAGDMTPGGGKKTWMYGSPFDLKELVLMDCSNEARFLRDLGACPDADSTPGHSEDKTKGFPGLSSLTISHTRKATSKLDTTSMESMMLESELNTDLLRAVKDLVEARNGLHVSNIPDSHSIPPAQYQDPLNTISSIRLEGCVVDEEDALWFRARVPNFATTSQPSVDEVFEPSKRSWPFL